MPAPLPSSLDELGIPTLLALAALLMAQEQRLLVAPTRRMALALMLDLRDSRIIDTPWPEARWSVDPAADETPLEHLQWRYIWPHVHRANLFERVDTLLEGVPWDDYGLALRLRAWNDLAAAEAESFLAGQLRKARFDLVWAQDMAFVVRAGEVHLPIAQWRYCAWAAVRHGAAMAQQQGDRDNATIREAIFGELKRRSRWVAGGDPLRYSFVPFEPTPSNAIARLFVNRLMRDRAAFWTVAPSVEALLGLQRLAPDTQSASARIASHFTAHD